LWASRRANIGTSAPVDPDFPGAAQNRSAHYPLGVASSSRTRFAQVGDVDIAYQVLGDGPIDILFWPGFLIPIDCMDEEPSMARFQRRLASFSRLIRFDPPRTSLGGSGSLSDPPTWAHQAQAAVAVLDAVGSVEAVMLAPYLFSSAGIVAAATYADRIRSLVVVNGYARFRWATDYPVGFPQDRIDSIMQSLLDSDAVEQGHDILAMVAPSVASDSAFRAWWDRAGNLAATPAMIRSGMVDFFETDVRQYLPKIRVPTIILQRRDIWLDVGNGRYLAEHIAGAKYVELPGTDSVYWVGDTGPMLDEIEEFVTGVRGGSGAERILATVLFTDIVGSTDRAAQLGDGRWRDLLDRHDQSVRIQIERFRGREVKTVGDGFVATFDSPSRAIECALAIGETLKALDIGVRAGIHTGEIEVRGDDVAGIAVHIGARVSALAGAGEVFVSSTVKDSVVGSSVEFEERGEHELKGVPGTWRLFSVTG
jgi:class 3 adenylate cyclase/pimeloyl-ACP methyl ester carboxylesterase